MSKREVAARKITNHIEGAIKELELWLLRSKVDTTIHYLRSKQSEALSEALEATKLLLKDPSEIKILEEIINRAMWSMIKEPIVYLKTLEDAEDIYECKSVIDRMFNVTDVYEKV
jgi:glutamyl-tRNA reductase